MRAAHRARLVRAAVAAHHLCFDSGYIESKYDIRITSVEKMDRHETRIEATDLEKNEAVASCLTVITHAEVIPAGSKQYVNWN